MAYYEEDDLQRFSEIARHRPDLFEKFMAWYQACQEDGALSRREKALIGLAVAHALQCPYCIDAFSQSCLEAGSNLEQMTEAIHMASALRGGASPRRTEIMPAEVAEQVLDAVRRFRFAVVDITGGAPELNPSFRRLVAESRRLGSRVLVRHNLTVMFEPGQEDLPE